MSLNLNVASSVINSMVDGHTIKRLDLLLRAGLGYGLWVMVFYATFNNISVADLTSVFFLRGC